MPANAGRALIVDEGTSWSTLCAVRALARAGWSVHVGCPGSRGIAAASRHVTGVHDVPSPGRGIDRFAAGVRDAVTRSGAEVVFGGGDAEVLALSIERGRLDAVVPYPEEGRVRRAFDKWELLEAARRVGLGAPTSATTMPDGPLDAPVLVKSRCHWDPGHRVDSTRLEATVAPTLDAVAAAMAAIRAAGGEPMIQEFVDGEHLSVVLLRAQDGHVLGRVHQRIEHRWPVPAGWTVRASTVAVDADLDARCADLLAELDWSGLVELEFIRPADGVPRLIDFNGRHYGSMELAVAAGVDLPTLWALDATRRPVAAAPEARVGVRFQRLGGDLRHALADRSRRTPGSVLGTLGYAWGAHHSTLRLRDPRPAFEYLAATVSGRRDRA